MREPIEVTSQNFNNIVANASTPVLIDFWASWCMPCRMLSPVVDEIAGFYDEKITVGKINVDESPDLAEKYSVMSIPTLLIFVNGEVKEKLVGVHPREAIESLLNAYV